MTSCFDYVHISLNFLSFYSLFSSIFYQWSILSSGRCIDDERKYFIAKRTNGAPCRTCSRPLPEQQLDELGSEDKGGGWVEKLPVAENPTLQEVKMMMEKKRRKQACLLLLCLLLKSRYCFLRPGTDHLKNRLLEAVDSYGRRLPF